MWCNQHQLQRSGRTPLDNARKQGHDEVVKILENAESWLHKCVNDSRSFDRSPLDCPCFDPCLMDCWLSFFHALQWTAAGVSTRFFPCIPGDVCPPFFHTNACFCPVSLHARFNLYLSFSPFLPWLSTATVSWLISSIDGNGSPGRLYRGLVL